MPSRWTQYEEDSSRLPFGFTRRAYDSDTEVYTFTDENGRKYKGEPGEMYGVLHPVIDINSSSLRITTALADGPDGNDRVVLLVEEAPLFPPTIIQPEYSEKHEDSYSYSSAKSDRDSLLSHQRSARARSLFACLANALDRFIDPPPVHNPGAVVAGSAALERFLACRHESEQNVYDKKSSTAWMNNKS